MSILSGRGQYANDADTLASIFIEYADEYVSRYKEEDEVGRYFWDTFKRKSGKQYYPITCPDGTVLQYEENGEPISWLRSEPRFLSDLKEGEARIIKVNGKWIVHFKQRQPKGYKPRSLVTEYGTTSSGADQLKAIFNVTNKFNNPKPSTLIQFLLKFSPNKKAIVLDFFAGSGSTGHAVMELNQEDGGRRKFILCTNNENGICKNVTYQRLKTVITGKRQDGSEYSEGIPANLMYFRTDFVEKESEELSENLLAHIREMIQLEHGVKIDDQKYVIIMDDEEMDTFEQNIGNYTQLKAVFINQEVFLSSSQEAMLENIDTHIIPDYYFDFELREAGEIW